MLVFLLAPAAVVLLTRDTGPVVDGQRLAAGKLPTDVAVDGSTVWVVSGRDNRVVALDARDAEQAPEVARDRAPRRCGSRSARARCGRPTRATTRSRASIRSCPGSGRGIKLPSEAVDIAVSADGHVGDQRRGGHRDAHRSDHQPRARRAGPHRQFPDGAGGRRGLRVGGQLRRRDGRAHRPSRGRRDRAPAAGRARSAGRRRRPRLGVGGQPRRRHGHAALGATTVAAQGAPIKVGGAPGALAITRDAVLVLDTVRGDVWSLSPRTGRLEHVSRVGGFPTSLAVGAGSAWVVDARGGSVTRLSER